MMAMADRRQFKRINVTGVVQGVGFRPFVYQLAHGFGLRGWVCNTSAGVDIEVEGPPQMLDDFVTALETEAPPLARIHQVVVSDGPGNGFTAFEIRHSVAQQGLFQPISPDICICEDCLHELFNPHDRRYRHPFINCTNCGPRFTIIQDIPYDRSSTTMQPFVMCPACQSEYNDPLDRRFHAQPNACPACGPRVWIHMLEGSKGAGGSLIQADESQDSDAAIALTQRLLAQSAIVAIKGLGGFHLACDAANDKAVRRLRERKGRVDKPFAIMSYDLAAVEQYCRVSDKERQLLRSRERPIVLLRQRPGSLISKWVAPGNKYLGVMLPYTPLHYLLLERRLPANQRQTSGSGSGFRALVMTSGNYSEEPIATGNEEALDRLSSLADACLFHNRGIYARCDDSVVRVFENHELPARRSRGYAPYPVHLPFRVRQILACGAELKNTFCFTRDDYAFMSQHIGDMENYETLVSYEAMITHFKGLFRMQPEIIAHDMHPDYLATRYAQRYTRNPKHQAQNKVSIVRPQDKRSAIKICSVQHHHAHIAACMAEHGLTESVIGVSFDGTGYGTDGHIWGGEFLICDYADFRRAAHLAYVPMPGGDAAVKSPYRMALSHLYNAFETLDLDLPPVRFPGSLELAVVERQIRGGLNAPVTSSMGRLFDAVASIIDLRQEVNYEAQAAIELEMIADDEISQPYSAAVAEMIEGVLKIGSKTDAGKASAQVLDPTPLIRSIVSELRAREPASAIAARFHNSLAQLICDVCILLDQQQGLKRVALSGGVFQNVYLLKRTVERLRPAGFEVYTHRLVPPNDGGIALGQAMIAHFSAQA